jgi:acyl-[acyl-carrier-protein] desaturase
VQAVWDVVENFEMPGSTIEGFTRRSLKIAIAGIYDLRIHRDEVLWPVLRHWKLFELEGLSAEAEQAREKLGRSWSSSTPRRARVEEKRAAQQARYAARG